MQYLYLCYHDEKRLDAMSTCESDAIMDETFARKEALRKHG